MIVTLNGCKREFEVGVTPQTVLKSFGERVLHSAVCVKVNGVASDLRTPITSDSVLEICTSSSKEGIDAIRYTASRMLAQAVKRIYPTAKVAGGEVVKDGYYYDFEFRSVVSQKDLGKIEAEMRRISKEKILITKELLDKKEAYDAFASDEETYQIESIMSGDSEKVSLDRQGDFADISKGINALCTNQVKAFKLTGVTGAYWKGEKSNKMLTRIHGIAFEKAACLEEYLSKQKLEEGYKHNTLGKKLGYFETDAKIGRGLPLLLPKGAIVVNKLVRFLEDEEEKLGFVPTKTPIFSKNDLFNSENGEKYGRAFVVRSEDSSASYALRTSLFPLQYSIYKSGLKSYKDLPVRYQETGNIFIKVDSGKIKGLTTSDQFTANSVCTLCAVGDLKNVLRENIMLLKNVVSAIGLSKESELCLCVRGKNKELYEGNSEDWQRAEDCFKEALSELGTKYFSRVAGVNSWGPRFEARTKLADGKTYVISEFAVDLLMPERFGLKYVDAQGEKKHPFGVVGRPLGYLERTLGAMLEKLKGEMPFWVAPEQVRVVSITERTVDYAGEINGLLLSMGVRAKCDIRDVKVGTKLHSAYSEMVPYVLVLGDKEKENNSITISDGSHEIATEMQKEEFFARIKEKTQINYNT